MIACVHAGIEECIEQPGAERALRAATAKHAVPKLKFKSFCSNNVPGWSEIWGIESSRPSLRVIDGGLKTLITVPRKLGCLIRHITTFNEYIGTVCANVRWSRPSLIRRDTPPPFLVSHWSQQKRDQPNRTILISITPWWKFCLVSAPRLQVIARRVYWEDYRCWCVPTRMVCTPRGSCRRPRNGSFWIGLDLSRRWWNWGALWWKWYVGETAAEQSWDLTVVKHWLGTNVTAKSKFCTLARVNDWKMVVDSLSCCMYGVTIGSGWLVGEFAPFCSIRMKLSQNRWIRSD